MPTNSLVKVTAFINPNDYKRWMSASLRLLTEMPGTASEYNRVNAVKYRNLVLMNISTQKYGPSFKPLSPVYREWKRANSFPLSFWILKGDLMKNIVVQKVGVADWESGPDPSAYDSGGKNWSMTGPPKSIAKYAQWVEEGTSKMPGRPVFGASSYEYHLRYWGYEGARVLAKMKGKWR